MLERLELLIGDKVDKIKNKNILLIGLGGVGGYTLESLIRSGIKHITIVDYDTIDITNLNRQLIALNTNIGKYKTDEYEIRIKNINPDVEVKTIKEKITLDNFNILNIETYDYVIDACDDINIKFQIIKECLLNKIKFISCMGTGYKLDPTKLQIMDIKKTSYDKIAKKLRKMIKDEKLSGKVMTVCSTEEVKRTSKVIASNSFVPATAGLLLTSYVINDIVGDIDENN